MEVAELVDWLRRDKECRVRAPSGIPSVGMLLPNDVEYFYQLCGGATLFQSADYTIDIVAPHDFVRANPVIVGENEVGDISHDWFIVAKSSDQYITIDLNRSRIGRCYDSFWDRHGVPGECQVIACTFSHMLEQLIGARGTYWYWLRDDFQSLGDAYDEHESS